MSTATAETIMAIHAIRRVVFLSMISFFVLSLSITASSVASLSYAENMGHFLPLSFLKIALFILAVFPMSSFLISQFPWKHLYNVAFWELFSISLRKPTVLRNSSRIGLISVSAYSMGVNIHKKWQLRHPDLSRMVYSLIIGDRK